VKTLITGASGFIGARLAAHCRSRGDLVVALGQVNTDIEALRCTELRKQGIDLVEVGLHETDAMRRQMDGCDRVFHLAAAQHEANVPDAHFWSVNVDGTRNVIETAIAAGVSRYVHGSTIGVFGSALEGEIGDDAPTRPDNIYGITKLAGEAVVAEYAGRLPSTIVRISETYGPGDGRLAKLFRAIKKRAFFVIGPGQNIHQLIFVDDLVTGLLKSAETGAAVGETYVLAGAERLTTTAMCAEVARAVGTPMRGFRAPLWPFLTAAIVLETTLRPLGIQPPLHRRRLDFFRKSFFFDQGKPQRLLGFNPTISFARGAELTARWYTDNGLC
jgi:nucleoside-diphosphate-sugar epimerase